MRATRSLSSNISRVVWTVSSEPSDYRPRKRPTLTTAQLEGWRSLQSMIARQAAE